MTWSDSCAFTSKRYERPTWPLRASQPHLAATARGFDAGARAADRRRRAATARVVIPGRPGGARAFHPQPNAGPRLPRPRPDRPAPAWPGRPAVCGRGDREPEHDDDGERDVRGRALPSTDERDDDTRDVHPDPRPLVPTLPITPSLRATPGCLLCLLLLAHPHPPTTSRLPPPRLRPSTITPGLPCQIYLAGRGRAVQREAVDGPSSKAQA